jgi:monoamine oxidase
VRTLNLRTLHVRKRDDSMVRLADKSWRTMDESRRLYPDFDLTRSWDLPFVPVLSGDENFESYLKRIGFSADQLQYVRRAYGNSIAEDIARVSAISCLSELQDETAGEGDFRILDGYDSIANHLTQGIDIRLETIVESVEWNDNGVRVIATDGQIFEADRALITLPIGVLQTGKVHFLPDLPADKQAAIQNLSMGPGIKMMYRFDEPVISPQIGVIYSALNPPMWWSPTFGRDLPYQIWTAFATGNWARELLALGETGALQKGLDTLRQELGRSDIQPSATHLMNWPADPFALGAYSVTRPGCVGARDELAKPTEKRLYWAGEATAPLPWIGTVHGAYASGLRAAAEILNDF